MSEHKTEIITNVEPINNCDIYSDMPKLELVDNSNVKHIDIQSNNCDDIQSNDYDDVKVNYTISSHSNGCLIIHGGCGGPHNIYVGDILFKDIKYVQK